MELPLVKNDAVVFGILMVVLALIFRTAQSECPAFRRFYRFVPPLLLCYFIPALLQYPLGLISSEVSRIYLVTSNYLLPASLVLLCLGIDFKALMGLGPKALIVFLAGALGVIIGGPLALLLVQKLAPGLIATDPDQLWRGLSTVAGSWIGGGANQTAMKEIFQVPDGLFASMILVDVLIANIWMGLLLYGASITGRIDRWLRADSSAIDALRDKMERYRASVERNPGMTDLILLMAVAFGGVAIGHLAADIVVPWLAERYEATLVRLRLESLLSGFFWLIVVTTTVGVVLSFTKARALEGVGASKWGSVFIYLLVVSIGMKMNLREIADNMGLLVVGVVWIIIHGVLMLAVARWIRAPFFFVAVGSQANIGGAASAPIVASAFSPALASVGVLLAVLGYALGTYGGIVAAFLMRAVTGGG